VKRLAALAAFQLSLFCKNRVDDSFFKQYSRLISPTVTEEEVASYPTDPAALFFDKPETARRYQFICDLCQDSPIALTAVQLYLLALMEERTLDLLRTALGVSEGLTIETAGRVICRNDESIDLAPQLRDAFDRVELLLQAEPGRDWWKAPFRLDGRLAAWLAGDDTPDRSLEGLCAVTVPEDLLPPATLTGAQAVRTAQQLAQRPGFSVVHIFGAPSSGRRHFARHVAQELGASLLIVPYEAIAPDGTLDLQLWRRVLRELLLTGRLLCLSGLDCPPEKRTARLSVTLKQLERDLAPLGRPVFLTTKEDIKIIPFLSCPVLSQRIPMPTILQSTQLWREMAEQTLPERAGNVPAQGLAAKMSLTAGQIQRILRLLRFQNPDGPWTERDIFKLCYQVLDDGRYENIRFVETSYTWEDLQLEPSLKKTLQAVCAQVENQGLVLDQWGLRRRYPYGRCVSVLMSGPPGTGKTMTAQVLAARLGLELYQVDLSQIVDKYIGETEKRLKQVFDQAEKSNMVLFFDEADALLGKRSEVKDSKDKYANTEVAYLLQRMESYQGIVLMATNQAGNMDTAFVRRFRYHLVFSLPGEDLRQRIWADALAGIPAEGIQTDYLARQFQLSGAQIKNIALNAAYQAAADGGVLHMDHLVRAVFQELQKEGKVMLASEFGEYGVMLSDWMNDSPGNTDPHP
jgi:hypothetical protein